MLRIDAILDLAPLWNGRRYIYIFRADHMILSQSDPLKTAL